MATRAKPARRRQPADEIEEETVDEEEAILDEAEEVDEAEEPAKPKKKKRARREAIDPTQLDWDSIMAGFSGQGDVIFIKGTLKLRCLPVYDIAELFVPVDSYYDGNKSTKYLMPVWWNDAPPGGSPIRAVLLTTKLVRNIGELAADDEYGLFDPEDGVAFIIKKTGSGQQSSTLINPGRKAVPVPEEVLDWYDEFDIMEVAKEFSEQQARRNAEQQKDKAKKDDGGATDDDKW